MRIDFNICIVSLPKDFTFTKDIYSKFSPSELEEFRETVKMYSEAGEETEITEHEMVDYFDELISILHKEGNLNPFDFDYTSENSSNKSVDEVHQDRLFWHILYLRNIIYRTKWCIKDVDIHCENIDGITQIINIYDDLERRDSGENHIHHKT